MALPLATGEQGTGHYHAYVRHPLFAEDPRHYVAALRLIEADLHTIFEYVEPSESHGIVYSHRIHQLLFRCCVEIEAHFRNILLSNGYVPAGRMTMNDYRLVNYTHRLSDYAIRYPGWRGGDGIWRPFMQWARTGEGSNTVNPSWWNSYNSSKHDRAQNFEHANLGNLLEAVAALNILYHSQYMGEDFESGPGNIQFDGGGYDSNDGMDNAIMRPFRIAVPHFSSYPFIYQFDWDTVRRNDRPIEEYEYLSVSTE